MGPQPTVYAAPFSVCAARKIVASVSSSRAPPSSASSDVVSVSRCSVASGRKYSRTSPLSMKKRLRSARDEEPAAEVLAAGVGVATDEGGAGGGRGEGG